MSDQVKCPHCNTIQDDYEVYVSADESDGGPAEMECGTCMEVFYFGFDWVLSVDEIMEAKKCDKCEETTPRVYDSHKNDDKLCVKCLLAEKNS